MTGVSEQEMEFVEEFELDMLDVAIRVGAVLLSNVGRCVVCGIISRWNCWMGVYWKGDEGR